MNAKQLKNSILQYAMQGKLVKQNPNDEPASELLKKVKSKFKQNKLHIPEEEIPFEIPSNWEWERLGNLGITQTGNTPSTSNPVFYNEKYIPFIKPADFEDGKLNYDNQYLSKEGSEKGRIIEVNSILMVCIGGSRGKCATNDKTVTCNQQINTITLDSSLINYEFMFAILNSDYFQSLMIYRATGTATPIVNKTTWSNFLVPVPPLNEQKKIVDALKALDDKIELYSTRYNYLSQINKSFPRNIEKSILQYAMQGKLVEQNPNDEPVSQLIERIKEEKIKLVEQKVIKKEKPLPPITEDEIPFEIPESWQWMRLNDVSIYIQRGKSPKYSSVEHTPVISQKCVQWSGFTFEPAKFIDPDTLGKYDDIRFLKSDDILWNSTGLGTIGRVGLYDESFNPYEKAVVDSHVTIVRTSKLVVSQYAYYYLSSPEVQNSIEDIASGSTKQKELNTSTIKSILIPIPPLNEQRRIVNKIEKLLNFTKDLSR